MLRDITELYRVTVDTAVSYKYIYYTKECAPKEARPVLYHTGKTIKVNQPDGSIKVAYMYGEKAWSYDVEEVERYREEQAVIRAQKLARNKMLKDIMAHYEAMSDDELRACLEDLDR